MFQLSSCNRRRFDPTFCRAEELVRTEVGRIQTMHAVYADAPTPPLYFLQANREQTERQRVRDKEMESETERGTSGKVKRERGRGKREKERERARGRKTTVCFSFAHKLCALSVFQTKVDGASYSMTWVVTSLTSSCGCCRRRSPSLCTPSPTPTRTPSRFTAALFCNLLALMTRIESFLENRRLCLSLAH